jgi:hypothetical protein
MQYILLFQGNNGYANVSQCYVVRAFACLVKSYTDSQVGLVNIRGSHSVTMGVGIEQHFEPLFSLHTSTEARGEGVKLKGRPQDSSGP